MSDLTGASFGGLISAIAAPAAHAAPPEPVTRDLRAALAEAEREIERKEARRLELWDELETTNAVAEKQRLAYRDMELDRRDARSELARKDAALRELYPIVTEALTGAIHGWTETQAVDFQRRCAAALHAREEANDVR